MPRIQLTINGQYFTDIHSSVPGTIGAWFVEQLLRFPELAFPSSQIQMRIDPLFSAPTEKFPGGVPDWNPDSRWNWTDTVQSGASYEETMQNIHDAIGRAIERTRAGGETEARMKTVQAAVAGQAEQQDAVPENYRG